LRYYHAPAGHAGRFFQFDEGIAPMQKLVASLIALTFLAVSGFAAAQEKKAEEKKAEAKKTEAKKDAKTAEKAPKKKKEGC
jgi:Ni/Co efflux regulator RcnB